MDTGTFLVRDVDQTIIDQLNKLAKKSKITRNELVTQILAAYVTGTQFSDMESRYHELLQKTTDVIAAQGAVIQKNQSLLERISAVMELNDDVYLALTSNKGEK